MYNNLPDKDNFLKNGFENHSEFQPVRISKSKAGYLLNIVARSQTFDPGVLGRLHDRPIKAE
jgi:hypothetical protein